MHKIYIKELEGEKIPRVIFYVNDFLNNNLKVNLKKTLLDELSGLKITSGSMAP